MSITFITWIIVFSSLTASILLGIKSVRKGDYTIMTMATTRLLLFLSAITYLSSHGSLSGFMVQISVALVVIADIVNVIIWFISKKYRDEMESKVILGTLKKIQDKYSALIENSLVGVYIFDSDGKIEYVNQSLGDFLEYKPHELLGRSIFDVVYQEDIPLVKNNIKRRISGEVDSIKYDIRMVTKSGLIKKVKVMGTLTRNGHDTISGSLLPCGD